MKGTGTGAGAVSASKAKANVNEHMLTLRAALMTDGGKDKDVTAGLAPAFLSHSLGDKTLSIRFSPRLSKAELAWTFSLSKAHMEEVYEAAGYGWDDEDKRGELAEQGARFLLVREANNHSNKSNDNSNSNNINNNNSNNSNSNNNTENRLVAFAHFRFTLQGEAVDRMEGETALFVLDLHVVDEYQRRGLGKHLLVLLELITRREKMSRVLFPVYRKDSATKSWLLKQGKGYAIDESMALLGFEAEDEGFEAYAKVFPSLTGDFHRSREGEQQSRGRKRGESAHKDHL